MRNPIRAMITFPGKLSAAPGSQGVFAFSGNLWLTSDHKIRMQSGSTPVEHEINPMLPVA